MNIYLTVVFTTETVHYIGERIEMRLKEQSVCIEAKWCMHRKIIIPSTGIIHWC